MTNSGKHIQQNLGKHIALYHMELAQLWRCPVTWCNVWKGTAQNCVDQRAHDILPVVKVANLDRWFPPWTVTREQWTSMTRPTISGVAVDTQLFSYIGVPQLHHYRVVNRSGTHGAFRGPYMRRLHSFLEESDATSLRDTEDRTADVSPRPKVTRRSVSRARMPHWPVRGGRFFQDHRIGLTSSLGGEHCTSSDGFGASSISGFGRRVSSSA